MNSLSFDANFAINSAVNKAFPNVQISGNGITWNGMNASDSQRNTSYLWVNTIKVTNQLNRGRPIDEHIKNTDVANIIAQNFESEHISIKQILPSSILVLSVKVDALVQRLRQAHQDPRLGVPVTLLKKRVVIDFSGPNIAKELHVGHLRSTIIGECLARIQEFIGHDLLRLNHVGDWGTQFGMLICHLKENHIDVDSLSLSDLMHAYREAKKVFDLNPQFKARSRAAVVDLQAKNEESLIIWNKICEVSRRAYQTIYDTLDVTLTERGESFYNPLLPDVAEELLQKGVANISNGALCVNTDGHEAPYMIRKSDGGFSYDATDIAALKHRVQVEGAERLIYVVDSGQAAHFDQLKQVGMKAGYLNESKIQLQHVGFGVVCGPDGKKFKTRSGDVALLKDLLDEAINKGTEILKARGIDDVEAGKILGVGAVKYADLKNARTSNYIFDSDKMLQMQGDSITHILYALVRIRALKDKIGKQEINGEFVLSDSQEVSLGFYLLQFADVIAKVDETLEPHHLCKFLQQLTTVFFKFYENCPVRGSQVENSRLLLCDLTEKITEKGLSLLGIRSLNRM